MTCLSLPKRRVISGHRLPLRARFELVGGPGSHSLPSHRPRRSLVLRRRAPRLRHFRVIIGLSEHSSQRLGRNTFLGHLVAKSKFPGACFVASLVSNLPPSL
jgi:hypothetical protein